MGGLHLPKDGTPTVYVSTAASPKTAAGLRDFAAQTGAKMKATINVVDLAPLPAEDAAGTGAKNAAVWTIALTGLLSMLAPWRFRDDAVAQVAGVLVASVLVALGVAVVLTVLGSTDQLLIWPMLLVALVTGSVMAGTRVVFGMPGEFLAVLVLLVIGVPSAGHTSAPELVPYGLGGIGQLLPAGAGSTLVRNAMYPPMVDVSRPIAVLLGWLAFGFVLCLVALVRNRVCDLAIA